MKDSLMYVSSNHHPAPRYVKCLIEKPSTLFREEHLKASYMFAVLSVFFCVAIGQGKVKKLNTVYNIFTYKLTLTAQYPGVTNRIFNQLHSCKS